MVIPAFFITRGPILRKHAVSAVSVDMMPTCLIGGNSNVRTSIPLGTADGMILIATAAPMSIHEYCVM
jgi:hypothetical protein